MDSCILVRKPSLLVQGPAPLQVKVPLVIVPPTTSRLARKLNLNTNSFVTCNSNYCSGSDVNGFVHNLAGRKNRTIRKWETFHVGL